MGEPIQFKDLAGKIGQEVGVSDWLEITQERVNKFAEATDDFQWIHVDVERAEKEMGGTIAHGFLTISLIPFLSRGLLNLEGVTRALNYGSDKVRFMSPVKVGKRIRMRQKLVSAEPKASGVLTKSECTIEIEGEAKPAAVVEYMILVFG
jgi:acyl dehydratase